MGLGWALGCEGGLDMALTQGLPPGWQLHLSTVVAW